MSFVANSQPNYFRTKVYPLGLETVMPSVRPKTYNSVRESIRSVMDVAAVVETVTDYIPEYYLINLMLPFLNIVKSQTQNNVLSEYLTEILTTNPEIPKGFAEFMMRSNDTKRYVLMYIVNHAGLFDKMKHLWERFAVIDVAWLGLYTLDNSLCPQPEKGPDFFQDRRDLFVSERGKCYSIRGIITSYSTPGVHTVDEAYYGPRLYDTLMDPIQPFSKRDRNKFFKLYYKHAVYNTHLLPDRMRKEDRALSYHYLKAHFIKKGI